MKKIVGVALLGGILLVLFIYAIGRGDKGRLVRLTAATPSGSTAMPVAIGSSTTADTFPGATAAPRGMPLAAGATTAGAAAGGDEAACERLADLCSTSDQKVDARECERKLADARKISGAGNVERSESCLVEAKTCAAASGCLSGGAGMGAVGEFLKGLGAAISR